MRILFVVHDASRTGAPIVLLHLMRWLKANTKVQSTTLILQNGEMDNDFAAVSTVYSWNEQTYYTSFVRRATSRINKFIHDEPLYKPFPNDLAKQQFDIVYLNTVASNRVAVMLKQIFRCPVVCHVHENEFTINNHYRDMLSEPVKNSIDHFIAVSKSTRDNLLDQHKISPASVSIVYEFVPTENITKVVSAADEIKQQLNLSDQFIVGGSGLTTWRKGIDLFVQLAQRLNALSPSNNIKLMWVGFESDEFKCQKDYELKRMGLEDKMIFTGSKKNPHDYFQLFNVFALTSREDPFPLVCLEAASLRKPVFCFEGSGGMPELIEKGGGKIVPYLDVDAMAKEILLCAANPQLAEDMGNAAHEMVQHYDVNKMSPQILELLSGINRQRN